MMFQKAVVLAGDNAYIQQIETTLKSVCIYHEKLDIYIFNQDIPQEWFLATRDLVEASGNALHDVKIFHEQLTDKWVNENLPHINYMTYARYFIPKFVPHDVVLYLDSDLVVTQSVDDLFELDLGNYYVAATRATFGAGIGFNAGVLLINNRLWKSENVMDKLLSLTSEHVDSAPEGDQTILNLLFKDCSIELEDAYNFQIGFDLGAASHGHDFIFDIPLDPLPKIIHYISGQKPWHLHSNMRLREIWWNYRNVQWSSIIASKEIKQLHHSVFHKPVTHCFTLTETDMLEEIETLVKSCPRCIFHIAAYTLMSDRLIHLGAYQNVRLYQAALPVTIRELISQCQVYLDINHGAKYVEEMTQVVEQGKTIFALSNTVTEEVSELVYSLDELVTSLNIL